MNVEMLKKSNRIIFETITGSHAYGLNTPQSDVDIRGLFYRTPKELMSLRELGPDPISDNTNDTSYYSLGKFFSLASDVNPNVVELLFMPKECIKICHPVVQNIFDKRHLFISKKAKFTFSGYGVAQIGRAKGANKWINNPKPETPPKREDFCWIIEDRGVVSKILSKIGVGEVPCRPVKMDDKYPADFLKKHNCAALEHAVNMFRLYYYGNEAKGVFRNNQLVTESIPLNHELTKFVGILIYNEAEYNKAMTDWKNYWTWKKERNDARWVSQERGEIDYDSKNIMHCYRIVMSGINILKNGEPIIRWTGEEQKFLMDIRSGKFQYDYIMNVVQDKIKELDSIYESSTIPNAVNMEKIDELYLESIEELNK